MDVSVAVGSEGFDLNPITGELYNHNRTQDTNATLIGGDVTITDEAAQAALVASGATADIALINTDLDQAQVLTRDEVNAAELYVSPQAVEEISGGFETVTQAFEAVKEIAEREGWFTPQVNDVLTQFEVDKMDEAELTQLYFALLSADCSVPTASFWDFHWLISPAYANTASCALPGGGTVSIEAVEDCTKYIGQMLKRAGVQGSKLAIKAAAIAGSLPFSVAAFVLTPANGGAWEETVTLADGTTAVIGMDTTMTASLTVAGQTYFCNMGTGACTDLGGVTPAPYMLAYDQESGGVIILITYPDPAPDFNEGFVPPSFEEAQEGFRGEGEDGPSAVITFPESFLEDPVAGGGFTTLDPEDVGSNVVAATGEGVDVNTSSWPTSDRRSYNSLGKRIEEHEAKLEEFRQNPTVRPGMGNQPSEVIQQQQQARIRHLEQEIAEFQRQREALVQKYD